MINILIADDHPIVRRGLRELIEDENDLKVECEVASAEEVLDKLKSCKVDVIILDISMPGKSGLDLIADLRIQYPDKPILVLSALAEEIYAKRVIKMGAHGFLNKESAPDLLISAIRKIYSGKKFVSTKLAELMADELSENNRKSSLENLSAREFEVVRLIGMGKTIGEIAENLNLSANTVSTYRARILEKLGLKNNAEIIQYCIQEKLFIN